LPEGKKKKDFHIIFHLRQTSHLDLALNKITNNHTWNTPIIPPDRKRKTATNEAFFHRLLLLFFVFSGGTWTKKARVRAEFLLGMIFTNLSWTEVCSVKHRMWVQPFDWSQRRHDRISG
jgi:hypothetical protein